MLHQLLTPHRGYSPLGGYSPSPGTTVRGCGHTRAPSCWERAEPATKELVQQMALERDREMGSGAGGRAAGSGSGLSHPKRPMLTRDSIYIITERFGLELVHANPHFGQDWGGKLQWLPPALIANNREGNCCSQRASIQHKELGAASPHASVPGTALELKR